MLQRWRLKWALNVVYGCAWHSNSSLVPPQCFISAGAATVWYLQKSLESASGASNFAYILMLTRREEVCFCYCTRRATRAAARGRVQLSHYYDTNSNIGIFEIGGSSEVNQQLFCT